MRPLLLLVCLGCAPKPALLGQVIDRNGEALPRVNIRLDPGNVELITDGEGRFFIDYLRDDDGERIKLAKRQSYSIEYFKVGYHPEEVAVDFKRGELELEAVTLAEDTIAVRESPDNIDPGVYPSRAQSSGGSYEGE